MSSFSISSNSKLELFTICFILLLLFELSSLLVSKIVLNGVFLYLNKAFEVELLLLLFEFIFS